MSMRRKLRTQKEAQKPTFHIRKNDLVEVITGEEKERRGRILEIIPEKTMAIVEGNDVICCPEIAILFPWGTAGLSRAARSPARMTWAARRRALWSLALRTHGT